jgi:hypothetical protein
MGNLTNLKFKDGDDDGGDFSLEFVNIEMVGNGYLVTFSYDDGDEEKEVYDYKDRKSMMKSIEQKLGV